MIKYLFKYLFIFGLFWANNGFSKELSDILANKIANKIYLIEGGPNTKYPYGIKSIKTNGNINKSRQICVQSIKNNYIRWQKSGKKYSFISFLGSRYAPVGVTNDPNNLNSNWVKNLNKMVDSETKKMFNR